MNVITQTRVSYTRITSYKECDVPLDFKLAYFLEINALGTKITDEHIEKIENKLKELED